MPAAGACMMGRFERVAPGARRETDAHASRIAMRPRTSGVLAGRALQRVGAPRGPRAGIDTACGCLRPAHVHDPRRVGGHAIGGRQARATASAHGPGRGGLR
jgi:hypothetical protein